MKRLILLRHGKALAETETGDHARALSSRGRAEASKAASAMVRQLVPDFALVSDARRTRDTFECVAAQIGRPLPHRMEAELYGADPETILRLVGAVPSGSRTLLVVGHNPGLGDLARALAVHGHHPSSIALAGGFPTSSFAVIALGGTDWAAVAEGGTLERFVTVDSLDAAD